MPSFQSLLTLPPSMSGQFAQLEGRKGPEWFATHDPGRPIGSGGGTANLLAEAWQSLGEGLTFEAWLRSRRKLIIHSGGQSRRLPAYAAAGKALAPIPVERGSIGQAFDQSLLDLQVAEMDGVFERAGDDIVAAIISGDALLRPEGLPRRLPSADVVCLGFEATPEEAKVFGAFFIPWGKGSHVDFVLQKPSPQQTLSHSETHRCLVDAGVWLLTEKAVMALMQLCGWNVASQTFEGEVKSFDLYADFGLALGAHPTQHLPQAAGLTCEVVAAGDDFYHFGTNRQLLDAVIRMQSQSTVKPSDLGFTTSARRRLNQHVLNTEFDEIPDFAPEAKVWIENAVVVTGSHFVGNNLVTNVPRLPFPLRLPAGVCLDFVPVGEDDWCVRPYGFDDPFKGGLATATWMGHEAGAWFDARGIDLAAVGLDPSHDIQEADLFPIVKLADLTSSRLEWLFGDHPTEDHSEWWIQSQRTSAQAIQGLANMTRLYQQRESLRTKTLETTLKNHTRSILLSTDLEKAARDLAKTPMPWDAYPVSASASPAQRLHERMFRATLLRERGDERAEALEVEAFRVLQEVVVGQESLQCTPPTSTLLPDQIVWGRAPLRMDLAGGWTDTPPYSMLYGGRVVNVAVELNGQPPVQVFGRVLPERHIILRSIDLGTQLKVTSYEELSSSIRELSEFSLAKTALALNGFSPLFLAGAESTLEGQLDAFGGGIELTMLAAVPKGSGLGTSSILSGAIISTLSEMCGHHFSRQQIFDRVSASEQMLTTGGGWQDQVGGLLPGIKLLSTTAGIRQEIVTHWLPEEALSEGIRSGCALLYYTGITRLAKGVLREIVRGMFLNSGHRLATVRKIGENTEAAVEALQKRSFTDLGSAIRRSWNLNRSLDSGTDPEPVAHLFGLIEDHILGAKLLGAGGGGYMLILAKDPEAAGRVKSLLRDGNPAKGARFVDLAISATGLEVSRS